MAHTNRDRYTKVQWIALALLFFVSAGFAAAKPDWPQLQARQQQDPNAGASTLTAAAQPAPSSTSSAQATSTSSSSAALAPSSSSPSSTPSSSPQKPGSGVGNAGSGGGVVIGPNGPITSHGGVIGPNSVIDPRRPVSRLSMLQPKQNAANPPLFPVGANIVFEWAFDNTTLVFAPANLTVEVSLTSNPKMIWPVANISGSATSVVWSTGTAVNPGLFMGFYTLSVYDTKIGKQGVATSGHLMPYSDLQFGLYIPEPYIPRTGAFCQTCSAASEVEVTFWACLVALATIVATCTL